MKDLDISLILNDDNHPNPNFIYKVRKNVYGIYAEPSKGRPFLLTAARDHEKAASSGIRTYDVKKGKRLFERLAQILRMKKVDAKRIGLDKAHISLLVFERLRKELGGRYFDISDAMLQERAVKDAAELRKLKAACRITDEAFAALIKDWHFKTEREVKDKLQSEIMKRGADLSFPTIAASGRGASDPHYDEEGVLRKGFMVIDFGARYKGYHADMRRTVFIGKPSGMDMEMYSAVLHSLEGSASAVKPGMKADDLFDLGKKRLGKYSELLIHSLGHGVGLQIHEDPSISPGSEDVFRDDNVFTIEPGVYAQGKLGIRIEDTFHLSDGKAVPLTKTSRELIIL